MKEKKIVKEEEKSKHPRSLVRQEGRYGM